MRHFVNMILLSASLFMLASCEEMGPVFTGDYEDPEEYRPYTDEDFAGSKFVTIQELKDMYETGKPFMITEDIVIKGQVTTTDRDGNFYRSFYIQDETSGIEIKIGKTGLYNLYKQGQWIYVKCKGLALGAYGGMVQLGYEDLTGKYETAYIDVQVIIDNHIFRGVVGEPVTPAVITSGSDISSRKYLGQLVTVKGLSYGNEIFCIIYDKDGNSVYLSGETHGVTTWAFSDDGFAKYLEKGFVTNPQNYEPQYYSVSQYFKLDNVDLQVRTSGYAKFADSELADSGVTSANAGKISLTGIMTVYNDNLQFVLNNLDGVAIE